jgi:hypothetical protein
LNLKEIRKTSTATTTEKNYKSTKLSQNNQTGRKKCKEIIS